LREGEGELVLSGGATDTALAGRPESPGDRQGREKMTNSFSV